MDTVAVSVPPDIVVVPAVSVNAPPTLKGLITITVPDVVRFPVITMPGASASNEPPLVTEPVIVPEPERVAPEAMDTVVFSDPPFKVVVPAVWLNVPPTVKGAATITVPDVF